MAVCGALGAPKALFRAAEIFWPLLAGVLTLVLVFALPGLDVKNLLPVTAAGCAGRRAQRADGVRRGGGGAVFCGLHRRRHAGNAGAARCAMRWCVRTCVLVTLLSVFTIGNLGAGLTAQLNHPFFTLLRNISLFHAVERFGALVIGLWVLPDFVLVAMLLTLAVNCLRAACTRNAQLFARKSRPRSCFCARRRSARVRCCWRKTPSTRTRCRQTSYRGLISRCSVSARSGRI